MAHGPVGNTFASLSTRLWKLCTVPAGQACLQAGNSSSVLDLRYSYDGVGNILNLRDKTSGGDQLQTFTYDDLDRLTGASGAYSAGYTYDAIGNLLTKTEDGVAYTLQYTDPLHVHAPQVVNGATYTYDATGNLTARAGDSLTYDAENRLASVTSAGVTVTFTYDGDGRRVALNSAIGIHSTGAIVIERFPKYGIVSARTQIALHFCSRWTTVQCPVTFWRPPDCCPAGANCKAEFSSKMKRCPKYLCALIRELF